MFQQVAVLLGLDDRDDALLEAALQLGRRGQAKRLYLVHIFERSAPLPMRSARARAERPEQLDLIVAATAEALPQVEVIGVHGDGRAPEEVARLSEREGLDLLVMGRAAADEGKDVWGPHGLRLLRTSDCSVLVVPVGTRVGFGSAAVGMDFSDTAIDALRAAMEVSDDVRSVAVVDGGAEPPDGATPEETLEELRIETRRFYEDTVGASISPAVLPEIDVVDATSPADALLMAAMDADLLVVGSRGLTPLAAVLLGSTAERLGGRCSQPLLVYRKRGTHVGIFGGLLRG